MRCNLHYLYGTVNLFQIVARTAGTTLRTWRNRNTSIGRFWTCPKSRIRRRKGLRGRWCKGIKKDIKLVFFVPNMRNRKRSLMPSIDSRPWARMSGTNLDAWLLPVILVLQSRVRVLTCSWTLYFKSVCSNLRIPVHLLVAIRLRSPIHTSTSLLRKTIHTLMYLILVSSTE